MAVAVIFRYASESGNDKGGGCQRIAMEFPQILDLRLDTVHFVGQYHEH